MNDTNINSELLSQQANTKKHIPLAVFAVILIHIVLFLILLIAAGCRAKARARRFMQGGTRMAQQSTTLNAVRGPAIATAAISPPSLSADLLTTARGAFEPVTAEPVLEKAKTEPHLKGMKQAPAQSTVGSSARRSTAGSAPTAAKFYVVQAGDTVEKIARRHGTTIQAIKSENKLKNNLIHPGQKLRVGNEKVKSSNEV